MSPALLPAAEAAHKADLPGSTYGVGVFVIDPHAEADEAMHEYGVKLTPFDKLPSADAVVAAVAHRELQALSMAGFGKTLSASGAFIDVKCTFNRGAIESVGYRLWRR